MPFDVVEAIESGAVQPDLLTLIELLAAVALDLRTRLGRVSWIGVLGSA